MAEGTIPQIRQAGQATHNLDLIEQWISGSAEILHGISAPKSARTAIPGAMFHLAIQYQESITLLCRKGLYAGAFALLRPLLEAMFRGAWLRYAATDQQLRDFAEGRLTPDRSKIDRDLAKVKPRYTEIRTHIDSIYGKVLHDFAHGGHQQMWSRIKDETIGEGHDVENVENLVHAVARLGYFCSLEITIGCNSHRHGERLQSLFHSLFPPGGKRDRLVQEAGEM